MLTDPFEGGPEMRTYIAGQVMGKDHEEEGDSYERIV